MDKNTEEEEKKEQQRTLRQNRALHLYFQWVADTLNDAGLDMRAVLKPEIEIPWEKNTVKNYMWRPIQKIQLQKRSTKELTTKDIDKIFETMNRHLAKDPINLHIPWPSIQAMVEKMRDEEDRKSYQLSDKT